MKWWKLFLIGAVLLGLDMITKAYVHAHIPYLGLSSPYFPYGGIGVFQGLFGGVNFSINHVINTGAAWGVFSRYQHLLIYFRIAILTFLATYLIFINREPNRRLPLVLVISGAVGNVIDYFYYGHVIDFFYFKFWGYSYPLFNVADSAIFCGIVYLIFQSWVQRKSQRAHAK
jgi:signal peptidase II